LNDVTFEIESGGSVIPEPVTIGGIVLAFAGLAGYVKRRKRL